VKWLIGIPVPVSDPVSQDDYRYQKAAGDANRPEFSNGRKSIKSEWPAGIRFGAHSRLKSDIA
jgi:hypothetical protein